MMGRKGHARRSILIYKKHFGEPLTESELEELAKLEARASDDLSIRLKPAIEYVRKMLEEADEHTRKAKEHGGQH